MSVWCVDCKFIQKIILGFQQLHITRSHIQPFQHLDPSCLVHERSLCMSRTRILYCWVLHIINHTVRRDVDFITKDTQNSSSTKAQEAKARPFYIRTNSLSLIKHITANSICYLHGRCKLNSIKCYNLSFRTSTLDASK